MDGAIQMQGKWDTGREIIRALFPPPHTPQAYQQFPKKYALTLKRPCTAEFRL